MNIYGKKVILRAIESDDLILLNKWANNPEIQYWLGGWHFPSSIKDQKKWYDSLEINSKNQRFAITTNEEGLIGTANLVDIDWKNKNAFHGLLIGDKDIRGKGYGRDAVFAIMQYAFEELGLNRLDGSIIEYNINSFKLYIDKCGWKKEGVKKEWYFRKNQFWDKVVVGITKSRYQEINDSRI
tara:strand:+ start:925 stop:1473 length:549 start_codon:yes stop_codon:yes gene_type:complete